MIYHDTYFGGTKFMGEEDIGIDMQRKKVIVVEGVRLCYNFARAV